MWTLLKFIGYNIHDHLVTIVIILNDFYLHLEIYFGLPLMIKFEWGVYLQTFSS